MRGPGRGSRGGGGPNRFRTDHQDQDKDMSQLPSERFSGHESFVCRFGWLPKVFKAVQSTPDLLRNDEAATNTLGIGRNMVRSIQFWAEAAGVIQPDEGGGHVPAPIGLRLFSATGWDPYLESLESLWLIHWQLSTNAALAAWNEVFGEGRLTRFDRQSLIEGLRRRAESATRPLAASTIEQHAGIFLQTYFQEDRNSDDSSWCPLQDLGLLRASKIDGGRPVFSADASTPVGLTLRVFGMALLEFVSRQSGRAYSADFGQVLKGAYSPGQVFRLDEYQLRLFIERLSEGPFEGALTFIDTADTQSVVLKPERIDASYWLRAPQKANAHA